MEDWLSDWMGPWFDEAPAFFPADPGDRTLALAVGTDTDHKTVWAAMDGWCAALEAGDRLLGLVVGTSGSEPVFAFSKQACPFEIGKRYLAKVVGTDTDHKPVLASFCKDCDAEPPQQIIECNPDPEDPCHEVTVPAAGFTLSVVDSEDPDRYPVGDFQLNWLTDRHLYMSRALDASEGPCIVTVEEFADDPFPGLTGNELWSDLLPIADTFFADSMRYIYEPCSGALSMVFYGTNPDCENVGTTTATSQIDRAIFTLVDCAPYFADINLGAGDWIASVA